MFCGTCNGVSCVLDPFPATSLPAVVPKLGSVAIPRHPPADGLQDRHAASRASWWDWRRMVAQVYAGVDVDRFAA